MATGWPRQWLVPDGQAMKQYLLEIEYRVIVESFEENAEDVANNFVAQLTELAATNDHIFGLQVNAFPIPSLNAD